MKPIVRTLLALAILALGIATLVGCSKKLSLIPAQLFRPTVTLTSAPIDTNVVCSPDPQRSCYSITMDWNGNDPDGRVDHYIYAVDPPEAGPGEGDTLWITTTDSEKRLVFNISSR